MYTETHKKDYAGAKVTAVTYFDWSFTSSQHQILLCFVTQASSTMIKEGPKIVTLSLGLEVVSNAIVHIYRAE